jgi:hypothetical protein
MTCCVEQPNLEGLWYVDSQNDKDGNPEAYSRDRVYLSFKMDSVLIIRDPRFGKNETETYVWDLSDSIAILGNTSYSFQYNVDSLILVSQDEFNSQLVLKKLNEYRKTNSLNREYFQGKFRLGNSERPVIREFRFLTNSIIQNESGISCSGYPFNKWSLFELNGFTFLDFGTSTPLLLIDSVSEQRAFLSSPINIKDSYYLVKIDEPIQKSVLIGEWIEKEGVRFNEQGHYQVTKDQRYRLNVSEDSLLLLPDGTKKRWVLDLNEHFIYFLNSWSDIEWELYEYSDHDLKIGIYDTITYAVDTVYFEKK